MHNYFEAVKLSKPEIVHEMNIEVDCNEPFHFSARMFSFYQKNEIENTIDKLLKEGIIVESNSPYASRVGLVKKKRWIIQNVYRFQRTE